MGFLHRQLARLAAALHLAEDIADRDRAHLAAAGEAGNLEHRHAAARLHLDLDFLVIQFAKAQLAPEAVARRLAGGRPNEHVEHTVLRRDLGAGLHFLALRFLHLADADIEQVADDLLDIAPDIADFGELGRFHLEEGRIGEFGQPA